MENIILLGADPEFVFVDSKAGRLIPANQLIGHGTGDRTGLECLIGHDGHPATAELRPLPAIRPTKLIYNLRKIILEAVVVSKTLEELSWIASPMYSETCGGHIHLSFWKSFWTPQETHIKCRACGSSFYGALSRYLDHQVSVPMEERILSKLGFLSENERRLSILPEHFRADMGENRLEWRTPPTWLLHPKLAFTYITLTRLFTRLFIGNHTFRGPWTCEAHENLLSRVKYRDDSTYLDSISKFSLLGEEKLLLSTMKSLLLMQYNIHEDFKWNWVGREEVASIRKEHKITPGTVFYKQKVDNQASSVRDPQPIPRPEDIEYTFRGQRPTGTFATTVTTSQDMPSQDTWIGPLVTQEPMREPVPDESVLPPVDPRRPRRR